MAASKVVMLAFVEAVARGLASAAAATDDCAKAFSRFRELDVPDFRIEKSVLRQRDNGHPNSPRQHKKKRKKK